MANLTNSGKLIVKINDIDSKIWTIPAGTDIGQELSDIKDSIGTLPSGKTAAQAIADVDTKADGIASDLSDHESYAETTYAKKSDLTTVYKYKSSVATFQDLPASGNTVWDVYDVQAAFDLDGKHYEAGTNVAWNGTWRDPLGGRVDLSNYYTKSEVDTLIDEGGAAVEALAWRVTTAEGKITTLEGKMTTAEGDIDALEGRMDTAETDIDAVEWRATALEGRMTTAEGSISSQGTRLTTAEWDIDSLEWRMDTAESDIDAVEGRATSLEGRADALETAVEAIETSVPAEIFFIDVPLTGITTTVSNANIKANSHVSFVVKSWTLNGYYLEKEVAAGALTITSSEAETATLEVMIINKKTA